MPTMCAHAASYMGAPMSVGVTAPNMNQAKFQIDMNSNSYVGQLRQQVASQPAFNTPPECLRMFLGGECQTHCALLVTLTHFADYDMTIC